MTIKLGVVMDPITSINIRKDTTFAMLLAAQARGWELRYMEQSDLSLRDSDCFARHRGLRVYDNSDRWFELTGETVGKAADLHVILMRKDPPVDIEYLYTTHLLERAAARGALIVNAPQALRDCNEKLFSLWFPQCVPPTLVTREGGAVKTFLAEHGDIILKPLHGMGGVSVFRLRTDDLNTNVIIETLTGLGRRLAMAQRFVPEIDQGDKRIIMIDGEPIPYALARVPAPGETRANLAVGGTGKGIPLSDHDRWICAEVGPTLRAKGLLFVGLDVIGNYLTEINVTSPTGARELDKMFNLNISSQFLDAVATRLEH